MNNYPNQKTPSAKPLTERIPPQAIEIEKSVLGSALINENVLDEFMNKASDEMFYARQNRVIYQAMAKLYISDSSVDITLLAEKLRAMEKLQTIGGEAYLAELVNTVATVSNIERYLEILKEKSSLRKLIYESGAITDSCFESDVDARELIDMAEQRIFAISEDTANNDPVPMKKLIMPAITMIKNSMNSGGITGLRTGFEKFDAMTTGLHAGELIIVAARPGMGKTAFVLSLAANIGRHQEKQETIAFFSLEMPKEQLVQRMLCSEAQINMHKIRGGSLSSNDMHRLMDSANKLSKAKLYIDDTPGLNVMEIRAKCRRIKSQEGGLGVVIIDYLQLMNGVGKSESRQQEVSLISRTLKEIAKELEVPVIALSQLSRAVEQRPGNSIPILSDLRESGSIEQDADIVLFLFRKAYYLGQQGDKDSDDYRQCEHLADLIIAKQRNGPIDTINLAFIGEYMRFDNLDEKHLEMEQPTF